MSDLARRVFGLATTAHRALAPSPEADAIAAVGERLSSPLRIAVAGKVKAGKSTLVNALVGESLAPTDLSECTTVVTWYRNGLTYRVTGHPHDGPTSALAFCRDDGELQIDLGIHAPSDLDRIEVEWPSAALSSITLIDTPGIDSINRETSLRTHEFLSAEDGPTATDAVLYLMRHLHENDIRFLEAFHDRSAARPSPINAVGILSRADEIGVARTDAMCSAKRIADRYSSDAKIQKLCQTVLPIAGLLASTATTLRQHEFATITWLSQDLGKTRELLLSVDRFGSNTAPTEIDQSERCGLLDRFGLFGIRLACDLVARQGVSTSQDLAVALKRHSGLDSLTDTIRTHFASRADVLRARSALLTLDMILHSSDDNRAAPLLVELERITSNVHEFAEIQLLNALRGGLVPVSVVNRARAEVLLGANGADVHHRLEISPESSRTEMLAAAHQEHRHWQQLAENPLTDRSIVDAFRTLLRTCEGLAASLSQQS